MVSVVDPNDAVSVSLTPRDLHLLLEGLDAYEYWQLGDVLPRNNGVVFLPDDPFADRYWAADLPVRVEQAEAIAEVKECRALAERLQVAAAAGAAIETLAEAELEDRGDAWT